MRIAVAERVRGWDGVKRALVAILLAGFALRLTLWLEWRPAFLGFSDSGGYLVNSDPAKTLFTAALRSPGYPIALMALRAVWDSLGWITALQHLFGLGAAGLYYAAAVRLGASRAWALLPAAVLALTGSLIFLEQAILAETTFVLLLGLALWLAARALDVERPLVLGALTLLAGLLLGWAAIGRTVAVPLVPLFAAWLAWAVGGPPRRRLIAGLPALVGAGGVLLAILLAAHAELGTYAFARNDAYQLYGRVAPFVDCRVIDVPKGTRDLCPTTDARDRPGHDYWSFDVNASPLVKKYGVAGGAVLPADLAKINAFSRAAILGQPKAYLRDVSRDLVRVVDPDFPSSPNPAVGNLGHGCTPQCMLDLMSDPVAGKSNIGYTPGEQEDHKATGFMRLWERSTRWTGAIMLAALLLLLAGPFVARGRARQGAVLFAVTTVVVIVFPIAVLSYDWRYVQAALGPLAAGVAIGATALTARPRRT